MYVSMGEYQAGKQQISINNPCKSGRVRSRQSDDVLYINYFVLILIPTITEY